MCFKIVQKKLILKMRGNHLKSSKKFLGFFLKKKMCWVSKNYKKLKEFAGEIHLKTWNIFFCNGCVDFLQLLIE